MKLPIGLVVVALAALFASVGAEKEQHDESIFVRTFRTLHGEPPPPPGRSGANITTLWIEQKLDQFNEDDERSWEMRYMSNDEFYEEGGPLFIYVGGEWGISPAFLTDGHLYDMAQENKGYLFYTEHRYYGESKPTSDISNENIKYLHVRQALADLAHFIRTMKSTIPGMSESKVILTGCSYAATMVTWFKKLYPDLATGCWASSAPLLAKVNFVEYKEVVGESIRLVGGERCYNRIQNGIAEMETMFADKRGAQVKAILKLCSPFDEYSDLDIWTLFSEISEIFAGIVQAHNDGHIQSVCKEIMSGDDDLSGVANYLLKKFKGEVCNDLSYMAHFAPISDSTYREEMMRQWIYQTCNEYGWYQTSDSRQQPFGSKIPITLFTTICNDAFGVNFTTEFINNQVVETNELFGGLQPVENVYMTHGQLDPWRKMGIQVAGQATVVPLYAHCKDFSSIMSRDTPEMRASKEKLAQLVREWVGTVAKGDSNLAKKNIEKF